MSEYLLLTFFVLSHYSVNKFGVDRICSSESVKKNFFILVLEA